MAKLVVTTAFGGYAPGQSITDPPTIAAILASSNALRVVQASDSSGAGGVIVPLQPSGVFIGSGAPSLSIALLYGFAYDQTAKVLYQWTGTAWGPVQQAGGVVSVPVSTSLPVISGIAQVGQTLTLSNGAFSGSPSSYAYKWQRNSTAILGAVSATYPQTSADLGTIITGSVVASNAVGASLPAVSVGVGPVVAATLAPPGPISTAPTITAVTSASLSFTWVPPSSGGAPSDYLVLYRVTGSTQWTTVDTQSTLRSYTLVGLAAATSYDMQVVAVNAAGQGGASPVLTSSTVAAAPVLQTLSLGSLAATTGSLFSTSIIGKTAGSTIAASSSDGTALTVSGATLSGTFITAGSATITLTETLVGATGSPKSSTPTVTVSAAATPIQTLSVTLPATGRTLLSVPLGSVPSGNAILITNPSAGVVPLDYSY